MQFSLFFPFSPHAYTATVLFKFPIYPASLDALFRRQLFPPFVCVCFFCCYFFRFILSLPKRSAGDRRTTCLPPRPLSCSKPQHLNYFFGQSRERQKQQRTRTRENNIENIYWYIREQPVNIRSRAQTARPFSPKPTNLTILILLLSQRFLVLVGFSSFRPCLALRHVLVLLM